MITMAAAGAFPPAIQTVTALSAVPQLVVPLRTERMYLCVQNVGASDLALGFISSWNGAGATLSPGGLGRQGGFFVWQKNYIPTNGIHACSLSSAGSTIAIIECVTV
jgi:hypothetical protein